MPWVDRIGRKLKLRDLHTLLAVAQRGSMAKAASDLAVTQPAVTKAIAELEKTLGVRLFDRTSKGAAPTQYGSALLKWSTVLFDDLRQAVDEIEFLADPTGGHLRIGATEPIVAGLLPAVIDHLSRRHPRITFHVWPASSVADQYRALRDRNLDLIIGRILRPLADDYLSTDILFDEPMHVVAGVGNPWLHRRRIDLPDLVNEPWCLPRSDGVAGSLVAEAFRARGLNAPQNGVVSNSVQMINAMLATGRYLSVMSGSTLNFSGKRFGIKALPVKLSAVTPPVGIVTLRKRAPSPVAQLFIETVHAVAESIGK